MIKKRVFLIIVLLFVVLSFKYFFKNDIYISRTISLEIEFDENDFPPIGTLFSIVDKNGKIISSAGLTRRWNSYSSNEIGEMHFFVKNNTNDDAVELINNIGKPSVEFKTGYSFIKDKNIYFIDKGNEFVYAYNENKFIEKKEIIINNNYYTNGYKFGYENDYIYACKIKNEDNCKIIKIKNGTWPYVFAGDKNGVISITNYGEMLIFKDDNWCRASEGRGEMYSCKYDNNIILEEPRGKQFYSSIFYNGKTLIGSWPTGRIYEFDGEVLKPSNLSLYLNSQYCDKEAQSMAIYCGDLYVGYWPRGEVAVYDLIDEKWIANYSFFSNSSQYDDKIPYSDIDFEGTTSFLGQRISSLQPYSNKLFVSTSNLRNWHVGIKDPVFLSKQKIDEYGMIYSIFKKGCLTTFLDVYKKKIVLEFLFLDDSIKIKQNGKIIGGSEYNGLPARELNVFYGEGLFGDFNGKIIKTNSFL